MNYLPLDRAFESPLLNLLNYPENNPQRARAQLSELQALGIEGFFTCGPVNASGQSVLGLGYCGLVLLGQRQGEKVAIKILRSDSTQPDLTLEADHQRYANRAGVGPVLHAATDSLIIMEYLPGTGLGNWLEECDPQKDCVQLRQILRSLLQDAFALDMVGLDHGALRCVAEHVIIDQGRATLIDFSHASRQRRAANVTTLIQGLFWGTNLAAGIGRCLPLPEREHLIPLLQNYKQQGSSTNFGALLNALPV